MIIPLRLLGYYVRVAKGLDVNKSRNIVKREDIQKKHEEDLQRIRNFRLLDDDFMSKVFEDKICAEILLRIILQREDLKVKYVHVQQEIKNLQGRSIRLDILAEDTSGKLYNVEVQRSDKGASRKRAKHNSSLLDANITDAGEEYEKLNSTYVIFITENDILKSGLPIYHIDRTVKETGESFEDGAHIIYVNSQIKNETELGKKAQEYIDKGNLVPDEITINMLKGKINQFKDSNGVVFDGFPRNKKQAEALEEMLEEQNQKVDLALFLDIPDEDIIYRTIKRRICSNKDCGAIYNLEYKKPKVEGICDICGSKLIQRKDDNEETITERLRVYHEQSKELIEYYEEKGLLYKVKLHANVNITEEMISEWLKNYNESR